VRVLLVQELEDCLVVSTSGEFFPGTTHWSLRQKQESLYLSGSRGEG
jgi:hypothetical protein